jgi:hypothetical protein
MQQLQCLQRQPGFAQNAPSFRRRVLRAPVLTRSAATQGDVGSIIPPLNTSGESRTSALRRYEGVAYGGKDGNCTQ